MNAKSPRKRILVTGAAGFLGRCTTKKLLDLGYESIGVDNYSSSRRQSIPGFQILEADLADMESAERAWREAGALDGVIHFAAKALVSESCDKPYEYFRNNLVSTLNLAELCNQSGIRAFIHSSSCAVYGVPERFPISEQESHKPISPYGETKRAGEEILRAFGQYKNLRVINLRYFNPGGALDTEFFGESHDPETHLIPNVVRRALADEPVDVFGNDYDTDDGTCIRDYFHVEDLANAHISAVDYALEQSGEKGSVDAINLGSGTGSSVLQVLKTTEQILGKPIQIRFQPRRPGDPARLFADNRKAREVLGWTPQRSLREILESEIAWQRAACHRP